MIPPNNVGVMLGVTASVLAGMRVRVGVLVCAGSGVAVDADAVAVRLATTVFAAAVWIKATSWVGAGVDAGAQAGIKIAPIRIRTNSFVFMWPLDLFSTLIFDSII